MKLPETRSLLPDVKEQLFTVNTALFVIGDEEVKKEKVLGSKF